MIHYSFIISKYDHTRNIMPNIQNNKGLCPWNFNIKIHDTIDFTGECIEIGKITDTIGGYQEIGLHKPINKERYESIFKTVDEALSLHLA